MKSKIKNYYILFLLLPFLVSLESCKKDEPVVYPFGPTMGIGPISDGNIMLYTTDGIVDSSYSKYVQTYLLTNIDDIAVGHYPHLIEVWGDSARFLFANHHLFYDFVVEEDTVTFTRNGTRLEAVIIGDDLRFIKGGYGLIFRNKAYLETKKVLGELNVQNAIDTLGFDSLFLVSLEYLYILYDGE